MGPAKIIHWSVKKATNDSFKSLLDALI